MKKLLALFIAALMLLSLTACNRGDSLGQKDGDEVMMEYDQEEMQEKLDKLKNEKGILIEMTVTSTETGEAPEVGTITYAENKDAFYFKSEEDEIMFDFSNPDKCVTYEKNTDGTWEKYDTVYAESGITREQMEASASLYTMALTGYLGNYSQFAGQMMTVTSDKVAGRNCDKFTYSMMFMGVGVEYTFCVDKETGMCLEWKMKAAAGMEGSATVEYTCTRFETPYTITFPKDAVDVTDGSGNNNNNNNNNDISGGGEIPENVFYAFQDAVGSDGDTWPTAEMWASIGLPALDYTESGENVLLMIANDSLSVTGYADNETLADTLEGLAAMLTDAGLEVDTVNTLTGGKQHVADYEYNGIPLQIRIGSNATAQINIFVSVNQY